MSEERKDMATGTFILVMAVALAVIAAAIWIVTMGAFP